MCGFLSVSSICEKQIAVSGNPQALALIQQAVKTNPVGKYYGLLVQKKYAIRFISPTEPKTLELRQCPVRFLSPGECVTLVACGSSDGRQVLAILKFQKCFQIPLVALEAFKPLHCVSEEELASFRQKSAERGFNHMWGWQFALEHTFAEPPILTKTTGEVVWTCFATHDIQARSWVGVHFMRVVQNAY